LPTAKQQNNAQYFLKYLHTMNKFILTTVLLLAGYIATAQQYGNEWINYNQSYFKIKVVDKGIYRLSAAQLAAAGVPTSGINPRHLQIFAKGVEQPIFVQGESDNVLDATDYVEFWGVPNNGKLDSMWYLSAGSYAHSYTSLYTDTNVYYLTWSSVPSTKRFVNSTSAVVSGTPESYIIDEKLQVMNSTYYQGLAITSQAFFSDFTKGEGYFSSTYAKGGSYNINIPTLTPYTGTAPAPSIEIVGWGQSDDLTALSVNPQNHHLTFGIGTSAATLQPIADIKFSGYNKYTVTNNNFGVSNIANGNTILNVSVVNDMGLQKDNNVIAYIKLTYPRTPDALGGSIIEPFTMVGSTGSSYLKIQNYGKSMPIIYDFTNNTRIVATKSGTDAQAMIPNGGTTKRLYVADETDARTAALAPVTFMNINAANNYKYLIITHDKLLPAANNYKNYRSSAAGGGYSTLLVTAQQLYDQFAYGIHNPAAIRNFAKYMIDGAPQDPKFMLLAGKAYNVRLVRNNKINDDLVPTVGDLASDNLLTYGLSGNTYSPAIPTGRIDARINADLQAYLNKVQIYETRPNNDATWQKEILHIAGGTTSSEESRFSSYLQLFEQNLVKAGLGANITAEATNYEMPTTVDFKQFTIDEFTKGKLMLNYYGHGSNSTLVPAIGSAADYPDASSTGKFPFMYISGCNVGDSYINTKGLAEDFVLEPNKGAIALLGQSSWGFESYLKNLGDIFSRRMATDNYGETLGELVQKTLTEYVVASDLNLIHAQQYTLHGDPAVRLTSYTQPDLKLQAAYLLPHTSTSDNFRLAVVVDNFGKGYGDSISVAITRTLPNGNIINYPFMKIMAPNNIDTIYFNIKEEILYNTAGNNQFNVLIDAQNVVNETNENNNAISFNTVVNGSKVVAVTPTEFAIVPTASVPLVIQNVDLFAANANYNFEIDTVPTFNSPWRNAYTVTNSGTLVSTSPVNLPFDNKVYYWRAKAANSTIWDVNTSFRRIQGSGAGWSQAHIGQYDDLSYTNMEYSATQPAFSFINNLASVSIRTDVYGASNTPFMGTRNNGTLTTGGSTCGATLRVTLFNATTIAPVQYDDCNTALANSIPFVLTNPADVANLELLLDTVSAGTYVGFMTFGNSAQYLLNGNIASKLSANYVSNPLFVGMNTSIPTSYTLIAQKGNLGFAVQDTAQSISSAYDRPAIIEKTIEGVWKQGSITTQPIGAAQSWGSVDFSFATNNVDEVKVDVIGINIYGQEVVLLRDLTAGASLSGINALNYPYIKLRANMSDPASRTPPQLKQWTVLYDPIPETAIIVDANFVMNGRVDSIRQGDSLKLVFKFKNTTNTTTDALNASYVITKNDGTKVTAKLETLTPFAPNEERTLVLEHPTLGFGGRNAVSVDILPNNVAREQILPNNEMDIIYFVEAKFFNPTPVELTIFAAKLNKNGNQAILNWTTASEDNNNYFDIERRLQNESQFVKVGKVKGAGNSQVKLDYVFADDLTDVANGKVYYRLKQVDFDGKYAHSPERFVDLDKHLLTYVQLYPNPAAQQLTLEIQVRNPDVVPSIQIMDVLGKPLMPAKILKSLNEGANIIDFITQPFVIVK
jgi:hypothetical protein